MKKIILSGIVVFAASLLAPQIAQAQGTVVYLSNLGQPSTGSLAVGSDLWLAAGFVTGTNSGGYLLDSVELGMTEASGNPSGFTVLLYARSSNPNAFLPGNSLGTLTGSLSPVTSGVYTYTPSSILALLPRAHYFVVLTAATTVANGAYQWSLASANYNPNGGWASVQPYNPYHSSDGSSWIAYLGNNPQLAISAGAVPEPGAFGLLVLGGLGFLWHRRKVKSV
jgi:hypothetical protein